MFNRVLNTPLQPFRLQSAEIIIIFMPLNNPANIYLFKVNYRNTRKRCEICSMLTITTPERPGVFISKLKIGHRKQERHRKFRLEVAVAVIRMLK